MIIFIFYSFKNFGFLFVEWELLIFMKIKKRLVSWFIVFSLCKIVGFWYGELCIYILYYNIVYVYIIFF